MSVRFPTRAVDTAQRITPAEPGAAGAAKGAIESWFKQLDTIDAAGRGDALLHNLDLKSGKLHLQYPGDAAAIEGKGQAAVDLFKRWYGRVVDTFRSNHHTLKSLDVQPDGKGGFDFNLVVHWHAVPHDTGQPNVDIDVAQKGKVVKGPEGRFLLQQLDATVLPQAPAAPAPGDGMGSAPQHSALAPAGPAAPAPKILALVEQASSDPARRTPIDAEATLKSSDIGAVVDRALVSYTGKLEQYVEISLQQMKSGGLNGLPPTQQVQPGLAWASQTAAIDQQRTLLAAALTARLDPKWGAKVMDQLIDWQNAFVSNFAEKGQVMGQIDFAASPPAKTPGQTANLRFTYALEGSAALARTLTEAADKSPDPKVRGRYLAEAQKAKDFVLSVGETFHRQFADPKVPGRYFLFENGEAPAGTPPDLAAQLRGLSHNNSQSYLLKGMEYLAELDPATWSPRLEQLLAFVQTQRDETGLLQEFELRAADGTRRPVEPALIAQVPGAGWQAQGDPPRQTVIGGHTVAGVFEAPAARAALAGKRSAIEAQLEDFVATMSRAGGVHSNGLLGNAFTLVPGADGADGAPARTEQLSWGEGLWQSDLIQQFLLHAVEAGVDLSRYAVNTVERGAGGAWVGGPALRLDEVLAKSLDVIDRQGFDGRVSNQELGQGLGDDRGRQFADTVNHKAETLDALRRTVAARGSSASVY